MEEYRILRETPDNSGTFTATGEVIDTNETDAKARCRELNLADGGRYGFWYYDSVGTAYDATHGLGETAGDTGGDTGDTVTAASRGARGA